MSLPHQAINKIYGDYNNSGQAEKIHCHMNGPQQEYIYKYNYTVHWYRKWQDYVYIQCEYKSTKQKIKHLLREENKVKENKIS